MLDPITSLVKDDELGTPSHTASLDALRPLVSLCAKARRGPASVVPGRSDTARRPVTWRDGCSDITVSTAAFTFGGGQVTVEITECHLVPGLGAHELRLRIRHRGPSQPDAPEPVMLTGTLSAGNPGRILGPIAPATLAIRNWDVTSDSLVAMVTDDQLVTINALPARDLELQVDLTLVRLRAPADAHPLMTAQARYRVDAATWSARLDQLGAAVALSVRVPTPLVGPDGGSYGLAKIGEHLRDARRHLENHRHRESAASCRLALELLLECEEVPDKPTIAELASGARRSVPEPRRWLLLLRATVELAHLSHHAAGTASDVRWGRTATESLLATTAALVNYYIDPHRTPLPA